MSVNWAKVRCYRGIHVALIPLNALMFTWDVLIGHALAALLPGAAAVFCGCVFTAQTRLLRKYDPRTCGHAEQWLRIFTGRPRSNPLTVSALERQCGIVPPPALEVRSSQAAKAWAYQHQRERDELAEGTGSRPGRDPCGEAVMIGPEMLTGAGIAIGAFMAGQWLPRPHRRRGAKAARTPQPVCGCGHHHGYHDPKTAECHGTQRVELLCASYDMPQPYADEPCTCRQYSGPTVLPEYFLPEIADQEGGA